MKKNQNLLRNTIIASTILVFFVLFILYALWLPSSQIFYKTVYKTNNNSIVLTFDDGPGPQTPSIFNELKENNMTAIFFVVCEHINLEEEKLLKNMSDSGMIIGLHANSHIINENYSSLFECKQRIENITGKTVIYYRPPYGFKAPQTMKAAKEMNMTIVLWSSFPRDYSAKNSEQIIKRVERKLKPGIIICMHDGPEHREKTTTALLVIIEDIKKINATNQQ